MLGAFNEGIGLESASTDCIVAAKILVGGRLGQSISDYKKSLIKINNYLYFTNFRLYSNKLAIHFN